ncbi:MAG: PASTA domain-containing protein [Bacteroides sp.]|jgi:beta-lactam-binding protein with PASTA domain|nr:PASTA domain-containing protein [Bacteroides sp.]
MDFWDFVKSKVFLRQVLLAAAAGIVVLWVSLKLLDIYTLHGRTITVPDLNGLTEQEASTILRKMDLRYTLNDSIFDDSKPKGTIANQDPSPGIEVKKNRTIYLTKVAVLPEMVPMPNLVDLSMRQAMALLEAYGLKIGNMEYRHDVAENAVLEQKFNNGKIEPETMVEKGTAIDLVIGRGLGETTVAVPSLLGKTRSEAIAALHSVSLNVGNEEFLDNENDDPRVFQQSPDPTVQRHYLLAGSAVNLTYRSGNRFDFEEYLSEMQSIPVPLLFGKDPDEVRATLEENMLELGNETFENNVSRQNARVYRQEPEYNQDVLVKKGSKVDVWYRSIDQF